MPRTSLGVSLPPFPAPTHKPANRALFIWSAVLFIVAASCVLGALTLYQTASRPVSVTAESAREIMPSAAPPAARSNGAVMPLPVPPAARSNDGSNAIDSGRPSTHAPAGIGSFLPAAKDIESRTGLLERVRTVKFAAVDIEAARAALSRLVEGGNAWAAVDLGSTYDPNILGALGIRSFPADARRRGPGTSWQNRWDRQKRSDCSKAWSAANDDPAKEAAGELYCIRALMGSIVTAAFARMPSCVAVLPDRPRPDS